MANEEPKQRLTAIINTDVVGCSRMLSRDRAASVHTLEVQRAKLDDFAKHYGVGFIAANGVVKAAYTSRAGLYPFCF